jgi:hypothetical protein
MLDFRLQPGHIADDQAGNVKRGGDKDDDDFNDSLYNNLGNPDD